MPRSAYREQPAEVGYVEDLFDRPGAVGERNRLLGGLGLFPQHEQHSERGTVDVLDPGKIDLELTHLPRFETGGIGVAEVAMRAEVEAAIQADGYFGVGLVHNSAHSVTLIC